jgi:hypothetical protein
MSNGEIKCVADELALAPGELRRATLPNPDPRRALAGQKPSFLSLLHCSVPLPLNLRQAGGPAYRFTDTRGPNECTGVIKIGADEDCMADYASTRRSRQVSAPAAQRTDDGQVEQQLRVQLQRLKLPECITRAIGERPGLRRTFATARIAIERDLPADYGAFEPGDGRGHQKGLTRCWHGRLISKPLAEVHAALADLSAGAARDAPNVACA